MVSAEWLDLTKFSRTFSRAEPISQQYTPAPGTFHVHTAHVAVNIAFANANGNDIKIFSS